MDVVVDFIPLVALVLLVTGLLRLSARQQQHRPRPGTPAQAGTRRDGSDRVFAIGASYKSGS